MKLELTFTTGNLDQVNAALPTMELAKGGKILVGGFEVGYWKQVVDELKGSIRYGIFDSLATGQTAVRSIGKEYTVEQILAVARQVVAEEKSLGGRIQWEAHLDKQGQRWLRFGVESVLGDWTVYCKFED